MLISSKDSKAFYPGNNIWEFSSELPTEIDLRKYHDVAVVQVDTNIESIKSLSAAYYIFSDICETSNVCGIHRSYLGSFVKPSIISTPKYLRLCQNSIRRIKIQIVTAEFTVPSTTVEDTEYFTLTLHFRTKDNVSDSNVRIADKTWGL